MPLMTEAQIELRRTSLLRAHRAFYVVSAIVIFGGLALATVSSGNGATAENLFFGFFLRAFVFCIAGLLFASILEDTRLDPNSFHWLPSSMCDSFADFCEENPCVQAYRDTVRKAGRRFTMAEYWAMRRWVSAQRDEEFAATEKAREREGCQRLYGIAGEA